MPLQPVSFNRIKPTALFSMRFGSQHSGDNQTPPVSPADSKDRFETSPANNPLYDPEHVFFEDPNEPATSVEDTPTGEYILVPDRMGKLLSEMRESPQVIQRAEVYERYGSERRIHKNPFDQRTYYNFRLASKRVSGSYIEFWRLGSSSGENVKVRDVSQNLPGTETFYIDQGGLLPFALNLRNPVDPLSGKIRPDDYNHDRFPAYHPVRWGDGLYIDQNFIPLTPPDQSNQGNPASTLTREEQQQEARQQLKNYTNLFQEDLAPPININYGQEDQPVTIPSVNPGFLVVARLLQDERYQNTLIQKHQNIFDSAETDARQDIQTLAQLAKGYLERSGDHVFYPADEKERELRWIDWE